MKRIYKPSEVLVEGSSEEQIHLLLKEKMGRSRRSDSPFCHLLQSGSLIPLIIDEEAGTTTHQGHGLGG